ncbi:MAG: hypothetical protein ACLPXB_07450 [Thiobacillaceae bacterium]
MVGSAARFGDPEGRLPLGKKKQENYQHRHGGGNGHSQVERVMR